jgi:hypothetical protein
MKHPASTAAVLLLGLAFLVGGATWLLAGSGDDGGQLAQLPATASSNEVGFTAITPKEQRKKVNMERTQREFKQIREVGEEVGENLYMIPDANGDPTYYSTELIKGRGRNGEPLFMSVQFKKTRTLPLRDPRKYIAPEQPKFKAKPTKGLIKSGKPPEDSDGAQDHSFGTGTGGTGDGGGSGGGSQAPSKTKGG